MDSFYNILAITPGKASFNGVYQYPFPLLTYSPAIKCRAIAFEPFTAMDSNPVTQSGPVGLKAACVTSAESSVASFLPPRCCTR